MPRHKKWSTCHVHSSLGKVEGSKQMEISTSLHHLLLALSIFFSFSLSVSDRTQIRRAWEHSHPWAEFRRNYHHLQPQHSCFVFLIGKSCARRQGTNGKRSTAEFSRKSAGCQTSVNASSFAFDSCWLLPLIDNGWRGWKGGSIRMKIMNETNKKGLVGERQRGRLIKPETVQCWYKVQGCCTPCPTSGSN